MHKWGRGRKRERISSRSSSGPSLHLAPPALPRDLWSAFSLQTAAVQVTRQCMSSVDSTLTGGGARWPRTTPRAGPAPGPSHGPSLTTTSRQTSGTAPCGQKQSILKERSLQLAICLLSFGAGATSPWCRGHGDMALHWLGNSFIAQELFPGFPQRRHEELHPYVKCFGLRFGKLFVPRGLGKSQGPWLFCTGTLSLESLRTIINLQPGGLPVS